MGYSTTKGMTVLWNLDKAATFSAREFRDEC